MKNKKDKPLKVLTKKGQKIFLIIGLICLIIFIFCLSFILMVLFGTIDFSSTLGNQLGIYIPLGVLILNFMAFIFSSIVIKIKCSEKID